jgi:hypothetical protein
MVVEVVMLLQVMLVVGDQLPVEQFYPITLFYMETQALELVELEVLDHLLRVLVVVLVVGDI